MYDGIINIYKEKGYTSFDVVARLRGILHQKKIGHTGTLDPEACGVLIVCLGKATKLVDILTDKNKTYKATLLLGKTSDTEDNTGTILSENEVKCSEDEVREAILSFVGDYEQIPPMYSAIKVDGKKLYELARKGQVIERKPRPVSILSIDNIEIELPYAKFDVTCSKGTYIRSLCRDIGEKLGCGGLMYDLERTMVCSDRTGKTFDISDSLLLDDVEKLVNDNEIEKYIYPIDSMFVNLKKAYVNEDGEKRLQNGNILYFNHIDRIEDSVDGIADDFEDKEDKYLLYDFSGTFKAIYRKEKNYLKIDKMF